MKRSSMLAALALLTPTAAFSADMTMVPLRGTLAETTPGSSFEGFHVGGHFGYSTANLDLSRQSNEQVNYMLRNSIMLNEMGIGNWQLLQKRDSRSTSFGGFLGYAMEMDGAVIGVEADYSKVNFSGNTGDSMTRTQILSDQRQYTVTVGANASAKLTDYATLRARLGYAFGDLMPYLTFGGAVGRFNTSTSTTVSGQVRDYSNPLIPGPWAALAVTPSSMTDAKRNNFRFGYAIGAGLEYNIFAGVFARAEYQLVRFNLGNTDVHTARVGVGARF